MSYNYSNYIYIYYFSVTSNNLCMTCIKVSPVTACSRLYFSRTREAMTRHVILILGRPTLQVKKRDPHPSPPPPSRQKKKEGKTLFEEPLIRTSLFHFEAILCVTFVFHLFCSTKQTHFSYVLQVGPTSLILWEAHPCKTSFPSWHSPLPSRELILFFEPPILSLPRGS